MNAPVILDLVQGTPEWHAHRATAMNASDAPAMMGASKYCSRSDLIRRIATGVVPEVDEATQRRFDAGHAAEADARPMIEAEIGDELYPVILAREVDGLKLSASLDGQTMDGALIWEHKLWSEPLAAQVRAGVLEPHYYWQLEHQLLVSGAERVIFTTSDGADKRESLEYRAVPGRAEQLLAGWKQFCADVAAYQPEPAAAPAPTAAHVEGFGALSLRVEGRVIASNLAAFRAGAESFIARLPKPTELETDQDFADADAAVKACAEAESRIKAAKDAALAQMSDVETVLRTADTIAESIRCARLALDKAVKAEKDRRKASIVRDGVEAVRAHYASINATMGAHAIQPPPSLTMDIGGSIKGLRTLASITDAVNGAVANAKIAASQRADQVRASVAALEAAMAGHESLFPDSVALCATKAPDDIRNLAAARIAEHEAKEAARIEAERERIRVEEAARIKREHASVELAAEPAPMTAAEVFDAITETGPADADDGRRLKLGDINARLAPLTIDAHGLASLGFEAVGTDRRAKLYRAADWLAICDAITRHVARAKSEGVK